MVTEASEPAKSAPPTLGPLSPNHQLDNSLVHGIAWTAGVKWTVQLLVWLSTFVVIRLLSPADYGIMGMATLYVGLIQMLSEFGVGTAVVTLHRLTRGEIAQLHTLAVALGVAGFIVISAAAVPLGWFFATPRLPPVILALGVGFVISGFGVVPSALLLRDMSFKRVALYGGAQSLLASAATLVLAFLGFRYWSLVLGNLAGIALFALLVLRQHPLAFARPRRSSIGEALNLSTNVIVARVAWYVYSNADFLTVGRVLGQIALGVYTVAWTVATLAVDKITATLAQVTPSIFSAAQSDHAALRRYLLRITEALSIVTFPICAGLALVATPMVEVVMGEKWVGVATPLQALALYGILRSVTSFLPQILNVVGDSSFPMRMGIVNAIAFPIAFYVGSRWGINGVAITWLVCYPLVSVPLYARVMRRIGLRPMDYLRALWPAVSGSGLMVVAVLLIDQMLALTPRPAARLVIDVVTGAGVYGVVLFALHRARLQTFRSVVGGMLGSGVKSRTGAPAVV